MKKIILGSASPRRRELLEQIGIEFEVAVSQTEEYYTSSIPQEIVRQLALRKAKSIAKRLADSEDCVIIGADTIVVQDGEILGKPKDAEDAFHMLKCLQGRMHKVYTGVVLLEYRNGKTVSRESHAEETKVFVHSMEDEEISRYIAGGESMDKAGGYGIQGPFAAYIDRIEGDYYNVVGLPLSYLYQRLKRFR